MKSIKTILLMGFFFVSIFINEAKAQTFSTVGNGTTSNSSFGYPAPFGNYYFGARHQFFISAAELSAAGLVANASVASLGFNVTALNGAPAHAGFSIKVYSTTSTNPLASSYVTTGMVAQTSTSNHLPVLGWNQFSLTSPFTWNGTSGLVIETCFNNTSWSNNASTQWTNNLTSTTVKSRYYFADASGVCSNTGTSGTSANTRPNIRFGWSSSLCSQPPFAFGTGNAPTGCTPVNITTCVYLGSEYSTVNNMQSGTSYTISYPAAATSIVVYNTSGVAIAGGSNPFVFTPTTTGTYRFAGFTANCGSNSSCNTLTVSNNNASPAAATAVNGSVCGIGSTTLSVTNVPTGSTIDWYATATGGAVLTGGTGTINFTTPSLTSTTTYYAQTRNTTTGCLSTTRTPVLATVGGSLPSTAYGTATAPSCGSTVNVTTCVYLGSEYSTVNNMEAGTSYTITYPAAASSVIVYNTSGVVIAAGANPYSFTPATTGSYRFAGFTTGCGSNTSCNTLNVTNNNPAPALATAVDGSRCGTGTVALSVSGVPTGSTIDWYAAATGGTVLTGGTGTSSFTTPSISTTTIYYAETRNTTTACISATRTAVTATVNTIPAIAIAVDGSSCGPDTVALSVINIPAGTDIDWYDAATGGTLLQSSGASFTSPLLSTTTVYYAETRDNTTSCISATRTAVTATIFDVPSTSISKSDVLCNGDNTGNASVTASGGTAPYTYAWSNGVLNSTNAQIGTGIYTITVTDSNNCTAIDSVQIDEPSLLLTSIIDSSDASCFGSEDGFSLVSANGGIQPYSYLWSDGQTTSLASDLGAGTFSVVVTDSNGCTSSTNVTIDEPVIIDTAVTVMDQTLTASLDSASYQWYDCESGLEIPGATSQSYTATVNGRYSVMITFEGCSAMSECYDITTVGREELYGDASRLNVFPNPNNGRFFIASDVDGTFNLVNGMGQIIQTVRVTSNNNFEIDLGHVATGVYYLIGADSDNRNVTKKIIVTKQ